MIRGFAGDVTLADVQWVYYWGDNTLVAWQVNVDADAQAYADTYGIRIITIADPRPGDLWNELLQAAMNQQGCVLANDTSGSGNPLTAQLVSGPSNGQLTLNADGTFSYTPNANFWGTDSFTYSAADGTNVSAPATVTITVGSTPVANNDAFTTPLGQELDAAVTGDMSDADGDSLYAVLLTGPANGQFTIDQYGDFTYVPNAGFHRDGLLQLFRDGRLCGHLRAGHGDHRCPITDRG